MQGNSTVATARFRVDGLAVIEHEEVVGIGCVPRD
jgi:hypothetical protein